MLNSNNLINKIFKSPSPSPSLLHLPPLLSLPPLSLSLLLLSAPFASYTPSTPSTLAPLGRLSRFSRRPPVASSGDIWDVPSSDEESKDENEDENKGEGEGEDEDKDSTPASRLG